MFLLLWLAACDTGEPAKSAGTGTDTDPGTDTDVVLPDPPDHAWVEALPDGMKAPPPNAHGGLDLVFDGDARDAVTAYADCAAWLSRCLSERAGDFGACVAAVPICQTEAPWDEGDCCPAACQARYTAAVAGGAPPHSAYIDTFAIDRTCFTGLAGGAR